MTPTALRFVISASLAILGGVAVAQAPKLKGTLIVANQKADTAYLIRLSDGKVVKKLPTGHGPHETAASPSGKIAVVSNYIDQNPSLLVIDVEKGEALRTIPVGDYTRPHGVLFLDEDHVICTSENTKRLALVDVKKGEVVRGLETERPGCHMFVISKDKKFAYSANIPIPSVSKIDIAIGKKIGEVTVGKASEGIGISPDGKFVWTANRGDETVSVVDTATMTVVKTLSSPGLPYRVAFTPNGKYGLVANPVAGTLDVFDATKLELAKRIDATKGSITFAPQGGPPAIGGVYPHPGSRYVFCTVINAEAVAVFDLEKGEVVAKYETGSSPDGISYSKIEVKD